MMLWMTKNNKLNKQMKMSRHGTQFILGVIQYAVKIVMLYCACAQSAVGAHVGTHEIIKYFSVLKGNKKCGLKAARMYEQTINCQKLVRAMAVQYSCLPDSKNFSSV